MSEKDTHEPEQNVTQPARRTKKKSAVKRAESSAKR